MKGSLLKEGDYGYWSKRSLELSNARLKYWLSANGDGEPLCDISLAGSSLSNPKSARSGKFAFRLDVPSGGKFNKFVLAGDTQADTARWVEAFRAQGVVINFEVSAPAVTIEQSNRSVDDDDDEGEEEPMLPSDSARSDSQSQASRSVCQSPRGSTSAPAPEASGSGTPRFRAAPGSSSKVPGLPSAAAGVSLAMTPVPPSVSKSASPLSPSRIGRQMTPRTPHTSLRNAYEEVLWLRFKREDLLQNHGGFHVSELTVDARQIDDEGAFFDEEKGSDNADGGAKKKEGEKEGKEAEGRKRTCLSSWSACFQVCLPPLASSMAAIPCSVRPETPPSALCVSAERLPSRLAWPLLVGGGEEGKDVGGRRAATRAGAVILGRNPVSEQGVFRCGENWRGGSPRGDGEVRTQAHWRRLDHQCMVVNRLDQGGGGACARQQPQRQFPLLLQARAAMRGKKIGRL